MGFSIHAHFSPLLSAKSWRKVETLAIDYIVFFFVVVLKMELLVQESLGRAI